MERERELNVSVSCCDGLSIMLAKPCTCTYQIEISLEGAELLGPEILWEDRCAEFSYISNAESSARLRPKDDPGMVSRGLNELALALQHFIESAWELLWYTPLSSARIVERREASIIGCATFVVIRHDDNGVSCEWLAVAAMIYNANESVGK